MASTSGVNITVSVALHTERHAHLIRYMEKWRAENPAGVSALFRAALELYIERQEVEGHQDSVSVREIEAACRRAVEAALKGRVVEVAPDDSGVRVISPETQTKGRLAQMREALDQWGEEG